jgi:hypothetical protein
VAGYVKLIFGHSYLGTKAMHALHEGASVV